MNISSCASEPDYDRLASLHLPTSQISYLVAIFVTFIASIIAIEMVWKRTIFQKSTKIIILLNIFYANAHQVSYGIEDVQLLYKHFFMLDEPCEILQYEGKCAIYFQFLIFECSGLFLCQTGLVIERACATFLKAYDNKKSLITTVIILLSVIIISSTTGRHMVDGDPLNDYSFSCVWFPKSSRHRANTFYVCCSCLTFFNLVTTILIMKINKMEEFSTRFKVGARFQKREVIESTETVCFLVLSQFILMFVYCCVILYMLWLRAAIPSYTFSSWTIWIYCVPLIAMMLPLVLIYRVRYNKTNRVLIIKSFTETKHTVDDHIKQMKTTWGEI